LSDLFTEAQLACAAIIASEPWLEFKHSPQYNDALEEKKCKVKNIGKLISDVVDPSVQPAALFLFFRQRSVSLGENEYKYLPSLKLVRLFYPRTVS